MAERPSDSELIESTLDGDQQAFGELVARYREAVVGAAYHRVGNFEEARDIAQEAFLRAYAALPNLRKRDSFASWLYRIADFTALQAARRLRSEAPLPADDAQMLTAAPSTTEKAGLALEIQAALATLKEPTRLAVILHYINGYSHDEIANFLGISTTAVRTRVSRAKSQLREELGKTMGETLQKKAKELDFGESFMAGVAAAMRAFGPPTVSRIMDAKPNWTEMWVERMQSGLSANPSDLFSFYLIIGRSSFGGGTLFLSEAPTSNMEELAPVLEILSKANRLKLLMHLAKEPANASELAKIVEKSERAVKADLALLESVEIVARTERNHYELVELGRAAVLSLLQLGSLEYGRKLRKDSAQKMESP
jgi:RNA polymerase sigma-70 factor (ECF subfamily)